MPNVPKRSTRSCWRICPRRSSRCPPCPRPRRPGNLGQARRLHRLGRRRQQGPQARIPDGRRSPGRPTGSSRPAASSRTTPGRPQPRRHGSAFAAPWSTDSVPDRSAAYHGSANLLLDRLGADLRFYDGSADADAAMAEIKQSRAAAGERPYVVSIGGSNAIGARAYVDAAAELLDQGDGARPVLQPRGAGHRQRRDPCGPRPRPRNLRRGDPGSRHQRESGPDAALERVRGLSSKAPPRCWGSGTSPRSW